MLISKYRLGILSEYLVIMWLRLKFYKILARRYKTRLGEVDIIAKKDGAFIFIEVKARRNLDLKYEIISPKQIERIKRAAIAYLATHNANNKDVRFDLIIVSKLVRMQHLKNIW